MVDFERGGDTASIDGLGRDLCGVEYRIETIRLERRLHRMGFIAYVAVLKRLDSSGNFRIEIDIRVVNR